MTRLSCFFTPCRTSAGFTLLGLTVAVGMVSIGIVGIVGLAVKNINANRLSANQFIAVGLAQEGVELVRNIRDNNWFSVVPPGSLGCSSTSCTTIPWRAGICDGQQQIIDIDINTLNPTLRAASGSAANGELYLENNAKYQHDANAGVPTIFRRTITIQTTGSGNCTTPVNSATTPSPPPGYITVTSSVDWLTDAATQTRRSYTVSEHLYDWITSRP